MSQPKQRVIFDSQDYYESECKAIAEMLVEDGEYDNVDEVPRERLINAANDSVYDDWLTELDNLKKAFGKNKALTQFTLGLWNSSPNGWATHDDIEKAIKDINNDVDDIRIWDENGRLYVNGYHHDGTNNFQIYLLTPEMQDWIENGDGQGLELKEAYETVIGKFDCFPRVAENVYGCKREEWE